VIKMPAATIYLTTEEISALQNITIEGISALDWLKRLRPNPVIPIEDNTLAATDKEVLKMKKPYKIVVHIPWTAYWELAIKEMPFTFDESGAVKRCGYSPAGTTKYGISHSDSALLHWISTVSPVCFKIKPVIESCIPESGPAGSDVSLNGSGFMPGESVTIDFGATTGIVTVTADSEGRFIATFTIPSTETKGKKTLKATGATSTISEEIEFEVT
jgi:hypothetical protein